MKKIYFLLFLSIFCIGNAFSQEKNTKSFLIKNCSDVRLKQQYELAVEKADFSCYRYKNKRRVMRFEDGAELELFSTVESFNNGVSINTNCYLNDGEVPGESVMKLDSNGHLLISQEKMDPKKNSKKVNN